MAKKKKRSYVCMSFRYMVALRNKSENVKLPEDSGRNRGLEIMDQLFQSNFWGKAESNSNLIPEKHKFAKVCVKAL